MQLKSFEIAGGFEIMTAEHQGREYQFKRATTNYKAGWQIRHRIVGRNGLVVTWRPVDLYQACVVRRLLAMRRSQAAVGAA